MDPYVEDCLLRWAAIGEFNADDDGESLGPAYVALAEACSEGRPLGAVLKAQVDGIWADWEDERRRTSSGSGPQAYFRSQEPLEYVHDVARLADAFLEADVVTRAELATFFRHRATTVTIPAVAPRSQGGGRLLEHLRNRAGELAEELPATEAYTRMRDLLSALLGAELITEDEHDELDELLLPAASAVWGSQPPARLSGWQRAFLGPSERRCGLRVLAVEFFENGVEVWIDQARRMRRADGSWPPLHDEVMGETAAMWPRFPNLRLFDDHGTRYESDETEVGLRFRPGVPAEATALWLADANVRFDLL